jgi:hypothetical protein
MPFRARVLSSTALAATGQVAGSAVAADGVKVDFGGYYHAAAGVIPAEDFSASSTVDEGDLRDYVCTMTSRSPPPMRCSPASPSMASSSIQTTGATTLPARTIRDSASARARTSPSEVAWG